jgi:L,D-transpeptidase catalytic domain
MKFSRFLALLALSLLSASCGLVDTMMTASGHGPKYLEGFNTAEQYDWKSSPLPDHDSYWEGDNVSGQSRIRISLSQQKAYFYKGNTLVGLSRISSGKEGRNTTPGQFKITKKVPDYRSGTYGFFKEKGTNRIVNDDADMSKDKVPPGCYYEGAPMFNFMCFAPGVGMHTGFLPGYAASHGCIRMPDKMAKIFYANVQVGTPVIVEP